MCLIAFLYFLCCTTAESRKLRRLCKTRLDLRYLPFSLKGQTDHRTNLRAESTENTLMALKSMAHHVKISLHGSASVDGILRYFWRCYQESLLETETARLLEGKAHASKTRQILEELIKAYFFDKHLQAER